MKVKDLTRREAVYLLEWIHEATRCADEARLRDLIIRLNFLVPFQRAGAVLCKDQANGNSGPLVNVALGYPEEFGREYVAHGYQAADPSISTEVYEVRYWEDSIKRYANAYELFHDLFSLCQDFGLKDSLAGRGYSCRIANPTGTEAGVLHYYGLSRKERHETVLSLASPYLHQAMSRILENLAADSPQISGREKEILQWLMQGKSTWDISTILNISQRTVKFHINNVMKKLDAVNRTHAVAIALRNRLIDLG